MITVLLNVRAHRWNPESQPQALILDEHPVEVDPEVIWRACNRIDSAEGDLPALPEWARPLRHGIDRAHASSMSVEDWIFVTSRDGHELGGWECAAFGWERHTGRDLRQTHTQGAKLWHLG